MVNHQDTHDTQLDRVFAALSVAARRRVLAQLALQDGDSGCTVTELSQQHGMSLPGFMKHLAVLEAAGLIARSKEGRVVHCALDAAPMQEAAMWMSRYERFWSAQLGALGRYLYHQEEITPWTEPRTEQTNPPASASPATTPSPPTRSGKPGQTRKR
ncbi:MAG: metalloregulator ArsR/SmtB family transcription factor [Pseudomonadota bacterium]